MRIILRRCHLAGGRHAHTVAVRELLPAADHGDHVAAEHTDQGLEYPGTRRLSGFRVHHIVDSVVPVHQHGRA